MQSDEDICSPLLSPNNSDVRVSTVLNAMVKIQMRGPAEAILLAYTAGRADLRLGCENPLAAFHPAKLTVASGKRKSKTSPMSPPLSV